MQVAVIGAGTLGSGIARDGALAGPAAGLLGLEEAALGRARATIKNSRERMARKETVTQSDAEEALSRVTPRAGLADLEDAGVVIEAVYESIDVKRGVWGRLAEVTSEGALLATNTSSLSVTEIAAFSGRP